MSTTLLKNIRGEAKMWRKACETAMNGQKLGSTHIKVTCEIAISPSVCYYNIPLSIDLPIVDRPSRDQRPEVSRSRTVKKN